tara:strand:+ start:361 stop:585 length:225 start_codon:yes stop_codon:yes gene_type:complete
MPETTLPTKINKKYSGPILLSQFSLRLMRFHKSIFKFSFTVAFGAVAIDRPLSIVPYVNSDVTIAVAQVAYASH